ncbi:unnamed protein product [Schistosoma rodhaini]|uniref:Tetratricopeptide repeat protein 21B n=2 Tax=Schistosoma rodhaini TaxID=6188 RepID=A0AA85FY36_9TREM|nr:unnamed protein product [Schistosoma rodhaini]CAH8566447.1 unnamed protein product [Schistosoma rodhaini]
MAHNDGELMASVFYYMREGYPFHALVALNVAHKKYPNEPFIKLLTSILLVAEGSLQEALRCFNELKNREEFSLASLISIEYLHTELPKIYQDVVEECEDRIRELRRHATDRSLYFGALVLFFFKKYDKAREYSEKALKINPCSKEILCLNGWIGLMCEDEDFQKKTVKYFDESECDDETMSIERLMGRIKYLQFSKSFSSALDVVNILVVKFPCYVPGLIEKMRIQLALQDWESASDTATRCLSIDPTCIEALKFQILYFLCYEGNTSAALKKLEELKNVLEISEPKTSNQYSSISKLISLICGREPTILQKVQELCEKAVELTPRNYHYLINLGHIVLMQGKLKESVQHFRNAINLCETSFDGLKAVVQCQLLQNNLQEASTQLEFLSELQPTIGKSSEVSYMVSVLRRRQGLSPSQILTPLNEAMELQLHKLRNVSLSLEYYELLNPDFLLQIISEYLIHAPPQPSNIGSTSRIFNDMAYINDQYDSVLMRCLRILEPLTLSAPGFQKGIYLTAYVHYMLRNTTIAISNVKKCLEVNPSFLDGYILLAKIHLYMSNLKAAEQTLETGVGNNFEIRNHPLYQLVRARIMSEQGSAKISVQILKQAIANLSNYSQSIKSNCFNYSFNDIMPSDKLSLYIELADAHRTLGEQHEATKVLQDAYLTFAGTVDVAQVTIAMANLALSQNDHETALNTLRQIQADHPYYITARQHMANIYLYHRKEKKLYTACYRELAEKLETTEAYFLLAEAYMTIQEPENAIKIYESILRKNPNDLRLASKIGHAFIKLHHYAKAISYYETAVKTGQNGLRLDLADLLINMKQYKKAKRLLHSMLTNEIMESASDINELQELCHALKLLIKLQTIEDDKLHERINSLNSLKSIQTRLLKRIQTSEVEDVVNEQKINLSEILLQLASVYFLDIQSQYGDYFNPNRFKDDHIQTMIGSNKNTSNTNSSQYLTIIINLCEDAIKHVSTIIDLKLSPSIQQGSESNLNVTNSLNEIQLNHIKLSVINIQAKSIVQLINLYMYTMDYVNCEQEILKLSQLQEIIETIFIHKNMKNVNKNLNFVKITSKSLKEKEEEQKDQQQQQQNNQKILLSNYMPNIPLSEIFMSRLMIMKGDFEIANKHLEYVLHRNPCHYEALSSLIDTYRRCGLLSRIPEYLQKAKSYDSQPEVSCGLNYCYGIYHFYTSELSVALSYFNRCRKDPEYSEMAIYRMVEICINPDNQLLGTEPFSQSNTNDNKNSNNTNDLNYGDELTRNYNIGCETAEQLLKELKVIKFKRRYRFISTLLLSTTKTKAHLESALETFAEMSHKDPDSVAPIYGAAVCYIQLKQSQKARNQLKRLAKVSWNFQDAEELEKSWLLLVDMYIQSGKLEVCQELLKKCLKYNKSSYKAYEYFGLIMEKEQNFSEAAKYYEYVWNNSNHQSPVIGYKLAYNYLKSKNYLGAIEVSLQVLSIYPNYPKIQKDILDKARLNLRV